MNYEELQEEYAINGHLTFMVALNIAMGHGVHLKDVLKNGALSQSNFIAREVSVPAVSLAQELANTDPLVLMAFIQRELPPIEGDDELIPRPNGGHEDGICPFCGAKIQYNGDQEITDDSDTAVTWHCPECESTGTACYHGVFAGHTDLYNGTHADPYDISHIDPYEDNK